MGKEFKTYNCQMRFLRDEKKIGCKGSEDKTILIRNGFFNLINGYKEPFIHTVEKDGKHNYIGRSCITHFESVKRFDVDLRMHLMKYIVQVEEEIRTVTGYKFDYINNLGKTTWYDVTSSNSNIDVQKRIRVISKCFNEIDRSRQKYIEHYLTKHKEIPTWIFVKTLNFSTFIEFFDICKPEVKNSVCELYGVLREDGKPDYNLMKSMMHWMRKIRNSCAHNERIYGIKKEDGRVIRPFKVFLPTRKNYITKHYSQRLIDVILYLRYFLPDTEYIAFIEDVERLLITLREKINGNAFDKVRAEMGIRSLDDLEILKNSSKDIKFNKF